MKTCAKLVSMVLSICLIASMLVMPAMATDGNVEMAVSATEAKVGDTFTVVVSNKDVTAESLIFFVGFDDTVVKLTEVQNVDGDKCSDYVTEPLYIETTNKKMPFNESTTYGFTTAVSGWTAAFISLTGGEVNYKAGVIATLTFEAIAAGNATLTLKNRYDDEVAIQTATVTVASDEPIHTHAWSETWSKDEADHWKTCSGCTEPGEKAAHTWNEGEVTTEPTETTTGVKTYTSTVCVQT